MRPRASLIRLVSVRGGATVDASGTSPGRGAYLCPSIDCYESGRRRIAGALRGAAVDPGALRAEFEQVVDGIVERQDE